MYIVTGNVIVTLQLTYESLNDIDDKTNAIGVYLFAIICDITSNLNKKRSFNASLVTIKV